MKKKSMKIFAVSLALVMGLVVACDSNSNAGIDYTSDQNETWEKGEDKVYFERRLWNKSEGKEVFTGDDSNQWKFSRTLPVFSYDGTVYFDKNDDSITSEKFSSNQPLSIELTWSLNGGMTNVPTNIKDGEFLFALEALDEHENILSFVQFKDKTMLPKEGEVEKTVFHLNKERANVSYIRLKLYQSYYKNFRGLNVGIGRVKVFSGENTPTTLPDEIQDDYVSTVKYTDYQTETPSDQRKADGITLQDLRKEVHDLTTTGNQRVLVVPVKFEDTTEDFFDYYEPGLGFDGMRRIIEQAYFGADGENGWESLSSFYYKSSYGQLNITGKVAPWYTFPGDGADFYNLAGGTASVYRLVDDIALWYKENFDDYPSFDSDDDGYFDCIQLIYAHENCIEHSSTRVCQDNKKYPEAGDLFWSFTWKRSGVKPLKGWPKPFTFCWISYDHLLNTFNKEYKDKNNHLLGDAHTIIHESGHALGLLDYYSTGYDGSTPAGGVDMMDNNIGDHCAYSKWQYNWVAPKEQIIYDSKDSKTQEYEITLKPFESSGDFVIVPAYSRDQLQEGKDPGKLDSPLNEYLTVEYYTPTGLNEQDSKSEYSLEGGSRAMSESGLKIFHVDSRLGYLSANNSTGEYVFNDYLKVNASKDILGSVNNNTMITFPHHNDGKEENYDGYRMIRCLFAQEIYEKPALGEEIIDPNDQDNKKTIKGHRTGNADLYGSPSSKTNDFGITNHQNFTFNNKYVNCYNIEITNKTEQSITLKFTYKAPAVAA